MTSTLEEKRETEVNVDTFVHNVNHVLELLCEKAKEDPTYYRKYAPIFSDMGHNAFTTACELGAKHD